MNVPSRPQRKAASTGNDKLARPTSSNVPGKSAYVRKAATNAQASKSTYGRKSVGLSPSQQPINDKDAGRGTGNVRGKRS